MAEQEALEAYASLWEQRILEISPGHPLPVTPDHLGESPPTVRLTEHLTFPQPSTNLTHQQLFDLYAALFYKLQEMTSEKDQLETSLKAEILLNEEQRNYIEMLRQAVDTRMEEIGIVTGSVDDFADVVQAKAQASEAQQSAAMLQDLVQDKESQLSQLVDKYQQATIEKENLTSTQANLQGQFVNKKQKYNNAKQEIADLTSNCEMLQTDLNRSITNVKKQNEEIRMLRSKGENYRKQLDESSTQNSRLRGELSARENEISELKHDIEEKESTIEAARSTIEDLASENTRQEAEIQTINNQRQQEVASMTEESQKLQVQIDTLTSAMNTLRDDLQQEKTEHQSAQQDIVNLNSDLAAKQQAYSELQMHADTINAKLAQTENFLVVKNHEVEKLTTTVQKTTKDLENIQTLHYSLQQELSTSETERSSLASTLELTRAKLAESESRFTTFARDSETQIVDQMEQTKNAHTQLDREIANRRSKEHTLSQTNHTIYQLTEKVAKMQATLDQVQSRNAQLERQLQEASSDADGLVRQVESNSLREEQLLSQVLRLAPGFDIGRREDSLQTVVDIVQILSDEIRTHQDQNDHLKARLDELVSRGDFQESETENLRKDLKSALEEIVTLRGRLNTTRAATEAKKSSPSPSKARQVTSPVDRRAITMRSALEIRPLTRSLAENLTHLTNIRNEAISPSHSRASIASCAQPATIFSRNSSFNNLSPVKTPHGSEIPRNSGSRAGGSRYDIRLPN